jgi:hypothetical protein
MQTVVVLKVRVESSYFLMIGRVGKGCCCLSSRAHGMYQYTLVCFIFE